MKGVVPLLIAILVIGLGVSSCADSNRVSNRVSESEKLEKIAQDKQDLVNQNEQLRKKVEEEKALREEQGTSNNSVPKVKSSGNVIAKKLGTSGGVMNLPPNYKLVLVTWKQDSMWVLYRPMRKDEVPEEYIYQEDSTFGIMEGTIKIKESRE